MTCYICDVCRDKLSIKQSENKDFQRVSSLESSFTCSGCWKLFSMAFEVTKRDETASDTFSERKNFLRSHSRESAPDFPYHCYVTVNSDVTEQKFTHVSEKNFSAVESEILPSDEFGEYSATYKVQKKKVDEKASFYVCQRSSSIKSTYTCKECEEKVPNENQHVNNIPQQTDETSQIDTSYATVKTGDPINNNLQTNLNSSRYEISNNNIGYNCCLEQPVFKDQDKSSLECNICHITLKTEGLFKKHMNKHNETNAFMSKLPKKSSTTRQKLIQHKVKHSNERPFICHICSKTFKFQSVLNQHMVQHSEKRPFKCNNCSSTFKLKSSLNQHLAITHSEERPFKCNICSSSFKRKTHLAQHMLTHSEIRPFKCNFCSSTFKLKSILYNHRVTHSEKRPYKCNICPSTFKFKHSLTFHLVTHSEK